MKNKQQQINSLKDIKLPIPKNKVLAIATLGVENDKYYKHVIHYVERFIKKSQKDKILPAIYVLDAVMKKAQLVYDRKDDVFSLRIIKLLPKILPDLINIQKLDLVFFFRLAKFQIQFKCIYYDKEKIIKVFGFWNQKDVVPKSICLLCVDYLTNGTDEKLNACNFALYLYLISFDLTEILSH